MSFVKPLLHYLDVVLYPFRFRQLSKVKKYDLNYYIIYYYYYYY